MMNQKLFNIYIYIMYNQLKLILNSQLNFSIPFAFFITFQFSLLVNGDHGAVNQLCSTVHCAGVALQYSYHVSTWPDYPNGHTHAIE